MLESSDGEEQFARMSNLHDIIIKMKVTKNKDETSREDKATEYYKPVTSSRAKLKSKHCSPLTPSVHPHKLSKEEQQVVEEMTTKLSDDEGLEEMVLQPRPVMLTGPG